MYRRLRAAELRADHAYFGIVITAKSTTRTAN